VLRHLLPLLLSLATASPAQPGVGAPLEQGGPAGRVALTGPWTVRIDPRSRGVASGFQAGAFRGRRVRAPFSPNATVFTGARGMASFRGTVGWFRTTFSVPVDGPYVLRFESVNHRATVWLDGHRVRSHVGGYLPFEVRTRLRAVRRHTLVVRADWRDPTRMKREGWHRSWFNFGGIDREVTLRPAGASDIVAPVITTHLANGGAAIVDVSARIRNHGAPRTIQAGGALVRGADRTTIAFAPVRVPAGGERTVRAQVRVERPALWAPGSPSLYDLQLSVPGEASWHSGVGLREIRRAGPRLLLNGRRLLLHGASIQEDAPGHGDALTGADMDRIVARLRRIHANATRAQHPLSPALVERLDAAGILVWQGVGPVDSPGNWTERTAAMQRVARERVRTSVAQLQTHPSILAWNLANEVAGQGHRGGQAAYIDAMARELHRTDPGRPVALDIWGTHPPHGPGPMYRHIDILGLTNYVGWYEATYASPAGMARVIRAKVGALQRAFPRRAIVVTEFGAEANARNRSASPGGYAFQSRLLATHIRTYSAMPALSGMLVWDLGDFAVSPQFAGGSIKRLVPRIRLVRGLNQKGLFTYGGHPKPAAAVVARAFARLR
jgi:Glycosyl hydrolases family 2, TIM barrel domain/Glycosyl hydrolases family 2, sugar binding domain/Glycosyl hydrolases family 2